MDEDAAYSDRTTHNKKQQTQQAQQTDLEDIQLDHE